MPVILITNFAVIVGIFLGGDHSILGGTEGGGPVINVDPSKGDHSTCWKRFRFGSQHSVVIPVSGVGIYPMIKNMHVYFDSSSEV